MARPLVAAGLLMRDDAGRMLMVRPTYKDGCDIPGGYVEPDESPAEAARRELREEAQVAASEWTHLTSAYSSPGISAELIHYYLARGLSVADRGDFEMLHEEADLEVLWAPFEEVLDAALAGRLTDAPLLVAVLTASAAGLVGTRR